MTDEQQVAPTEATEEVVQTEVQETSAAEAPKSTEGQVETPPAEVEAKEPETEEMSDSKKRRERRKAENQRLREEARAAQERLAEQEARLEKARQSAQSNEPPKEDQFNDYNEYLVAMGAYHAARNMDSRVEREAQEAAEAQKAEVERVQQQYRQEVALSWQAQAEDARTRYADFDKVVTAPDLPISEQMGVMLAQSDFGADIAYHLGTHRAEAARLAQMTPIEQAMELGRLEARVSLPKPNTAPAAPDPVTPVKPRGTATKDPSKMTNTEYRAWRASQSQRM